VRVDADRSVARRRQALERGVGNLPENAAKFDPAGSDAAGPVELTVERGRITLADRGPGIAAADAGRVFDRFYRAGAARGLPGSGLDLSIMRDVAETPRRNGLRRDAAGWRRGRRLHRRPRATLTELPTRRRRGLT
jgi:two-component system sensor histidine kinase MprB